MLLAGRGQPSLVTCNAALSACEKDHEWAQLLELVRQVQRLRGCSSAHEGLLSRGLEPNAISYGATILPRRAGNKTCNWT